jgi:hypothetical protein
MVARSVIAVLVSPGSIMWSIVIVRPGFFATPVQTLGGSIRVTVDVKGG